MLPKPVVSFSLKEPDQLTVPVLGMVKVWVVEPFDTYKLLPIGPLSVAPVNIKLVTCDLVDEPYADTVT